MLGGFLILNIRWVLTSPTPSETNKSNLVSFSKKKIELYWHLICGMLIWSSSDYRLRENGDFQKYKTQMVVSLFTIHLCLFCMRHSSFSSSQVLQASLPHEFWRTVNMYRFNMQPIATLLLPPFNQSETKGTNESYRFMMVY